jgi:hypothetical protein
MTERSREFSRLNETGTRIAVVEPELSATVHFARS